MKQHCLRTRRRVLQLFPPVTDELAHVTLSLPEFPNPLPKQVEFLFSQVQHAMTGDTAAIAAAQNLR